MRNSTAGNSNIIFCDNGMTVKSHAVVHCRFRRNSLVPSRTISAFPEGFRKWFDLGAVPVALGVDFRSAAGVGKGIYLWHITIAIPVCFRGSLHSVIIHRHAEHLHIL